MEQLTPVENIRFMCKILGYENENDEFVQKILSSYDLHSCANINVSACSRVQRKKLSLALCLESDCKVLLLDEPTLGMDL